MSVVLRELYMSWMISFQYFMHVMLITLRYEWTDAREINKGFFYKKNSLI